MELIVNLGLWDILIRCDQEEIISAIKELFDPRTSLVPRKDVQLLVCDIHDDPEQFHHLNNTLDFDAATLEISPNVTAEYSLEEGATFIRVLYTAIIELTDKDPFYARVNLEPLSVSGNSMRPVPEAFFYPLVVEWMRNVNTYLVHCGAAAINGRAVILIGPPGSGKSTHVLRMLQKGADFLADDILLIHERDGELLLMPFREVANLGEGSVKRFPDMAFLTDAPQRGDGKYQVSIGNYFTKQAISLASPGIVLHLFPEQESWIRERAAEDALEGIHNMNWFVSRKKESIENFFLLTDLMMASHHIDVSQGYLAENLDELMARLSSLLN